MDELTFDNQTYVSSKKAAQITGYAKDYIGQLCREGRVIARLIGRNWYVLETSIREHRFGPQVVVEDTPDEVVVESSPEEKKEEENNEIQTPLAPLAETVSDDWKASSYSSDPEPELLPVLKSDDSLEEKPKIKHYSSNVVNEMQSAWHDWFVKTNEVKVSEETLLENEPAFSKEEEISSIDSLEIGSIPVTLERVTKAIENREDNEEKEEIVTIHRTYRDSASNSPTYAEIPVSTTPAYELEGRIIHERKIVPRKQASPYTKAILVTAAFLAIGSTILGSGVAEKYIPSQAASFPLVKILSGESTVNK